MMPTDKCSAQADHIVSSPPVNEADGYTELNVRLEGQSEHRHQAYCYFNMQAFQLPR